MVERRRCGTKLHVNAESAGPTGLNFIRVLIHGLTAAATECRAFGAVKPNDNQGESDMLFPLKRAEP